ncbi:ABC transporter ATP-binding protein [Geodermatophilus bullaregiensis]|uniref:ABC transporter ATP-binding protein n=1 Tax=Geodermatophilus bullaregiensis TaxID=1564160 RepID=UPI00195A2BE2|nr:ABC transporter ATP-binding protein [Geodermatophilus bullaregiensis]
MALAQQTDLLLLDEPTTFLDVSHRIEVLDLLTDLNRSRGTTVVMVLHDLNMAARYADHLVALTSGRVHATGGPQQVLTEESVRAVFGLDSRIITDPTSGRPLVLPIGRHHTRRRPLPCAASRWGIPRGTGTSRGPAPRASPPTVPLRDRHALGAGDGCGGRRGVTPRRCGERSREPRCPARPRRATLVACSSSSSSRTGPGRTPDAVDVPGCVRVPRAARPGVASRLEEGLPPCTC